MRGRLSRLLVPLLLALALFAVYSFTVDRGLLPKQYHNWLLFAAWLPLIFFVVRLLDLVAFDVFARRKDRAVDAPLLLREIFAIALYFVAIGWALSSILDVSVTGFLATGTVLAAVLGLALQDTLGNLFAGIALHLEDTFDVGDVIRSGEHIGVVESVRWRGTRIRTFNNNLVVLPNSLISRERLEVFPKDNVNARVIQVATDYHVAPATVIALLKRVAANVEGVSPAAPVVSRVAGFGEFAVTYDIKYFLHDYAQRDRIDADIRKAVWYAFRRSDITFPVPIRSHRPYERPGEDRHMTAGDVLARLSRIDILAPLAPEEHEAIAAAAHVQAYANGETILRRGEAGDSMFIVHEGAVSVRVDGDEVARLQPGDFFGEMALLTGEARAADIVAVTDVVTIEIAKHALAPVLRDHPDLAASISEAFVERRDSLESHRHPAGEEGKSTLARIKAWFGL